MRTLYHAEIKNNVKGELWVDDMNHNFKRMTEMELAVYVGALIGRNLDFAKKENKVGRFIVNVHWLEGGAE